MLYKRILFFGKSYVTFEIVPSITQINVSIIPEKTELCKCTFNGYRRIG